MAANDREIVVPFPMRGVHRGFAFSQQPEQTTPMALNMLPRGGPTTSQRLRGAPRPGLDLDFHQPRDNAGTPGYGDSYAMPVRLFYKCRVVDSPSTAGVIGYTEDIERRGQVANVPADHAGTENLHETFGDANDQVYFTYKPAPSTGDLGAKSGDVPAATGEVKSFDVFYWLKNNHPGSGENNILYQERVFDQPGYPDPPPPSQAAEPLTYASPSGYRLTIDDDYVDQGYSDESYNLGLFVRQMKRPETMDYGLGFNYKVYIPRVPSGQSGSLWHDHTSNPGNGPDYRNWTHRMSWVGFFGMDDSDPTAASGFYWVYTIYGGSKWNDGESKWQYWANAILEVWYGGDGAAGLLDSYETSQYTQDTPAELYTAIENSTESWMQHPVTIKADVARASSLPYTPGNPIEPATITVTVESVNSNASAEVFLDSADLSGKTITGGVCGVGMHNAWTRAYRPIIYFHPTQGWVVGSWRHRVDATMEFPVSVHLNGLEYGYYDTSGGESSSDAIIGNRYDVTICAAHGDLFARKTAGYEIVSFYDAGGFSLDSPSYDTNFLSRITTLHPVQATHINNKTFIADYDTTELSAATGEHQSGDGTNIFKDTTEVTDWTTEFPKMTGASTYSYPAYVLVILGGTNITTGTYQITDMHSGYLTLDRPFVPLTTTITSDISYYITRALKVYDPSDDSLSVWVADEGTLPHGAHTICRYQDRIFLAFENAWYCSRQGDENDWDYSQTDIQSAIAGSATEQGTLGDSITALVPFGNDYLIIGTKHELWVLRGDPGGGGVLDNISTSVGIVSQFSATVTPEGDMIFLSDDGLYRLPYGANSRPQPLSNTVIPQAMVGQLGRGGDDPMDTTRVAPMVCYDHNLNAALVAIPKLKYTDTTLDNYTVPFFAFYLPTGSLWEWERGKAQGETISYGGNAAADDAEVDRNVAPCYLWNDGKLAVCGTFGGTVGGYRLLRCGDHYRRDETKGNSGILAAETRLAIGPIFLGASPGGDGILKAIHTEFDNTSLSTPPTGVALFLFVGGSPSDLVYQMGLDSLRFENDAFPATPTTPDATEAFAFGVTGDGFSSTWRPRARGRWVYLVLTGRGSDGRHGERIWEFEQLVATITPKLRHRRHDPSAIGQQNNDAGGFR